MRRLFGVFAERLLHNVPMESCLGVFLGSVNAGIFLAECCWGNFVGGILLGEFCWECLCC